MRTNLESLGGIVEVQGTVGKGSAFVARLPLAQTLVSSSLISALVVKCADERYAIPQTAVDEIIKVNSRSERDQIRISMRIVTFASAESVHGIPVLAVEEFFRLVPITRVPLADPRRRVDEPARRQWVSLSGTS